MQQITGDVRFLQNKQNTCY